MTTSIRPVARAHQGRYNVKVRDGRDWNRLVEGEGFGNFSMGPYGVTIYGTGDGWTLIPWSNIVIIEPTT